MSQLKAVIFDVDGVLIDSREANVQFFQNLVEHAGYPRPSRQAAEECQHLTMWDALQQLTGATDPNEIERIWLRGATDNVYPTHLMKYPDNVVAILQELHKTYRLGIVTGRIKKGVDDLYEGVDVGKFFEFAVTAEDYTKPKPHPEPMRVALNKLKLEPKETVYIGDSPSDIESATAAGMPSIHLAPYKHKDATVGIEDFSEIPAAVAKVAAL